MEESVVLYYSLAAIINECAKPIKNIRLSLELLVISLALQRIYFSAGLSDNGNSCNCMWIMQEELEEVRIPEGYRAPQAP